MCLKLKFLRLFPLTIIEVLTVGCLPYYFGLYSSKIKNMHQFSAFIQKINVHSKFWFSYFHLVFSVPGPLMHIIKQYHFLIFFVHMLLPAPWIVHHLTTERLLPNCLLLLQQNVFGLRFHKIYNYTCSLGYNYLFISYLCGLYHRIGVFAESVSYFSQLSTADKTVLLSYNLESVCVVRIAFNLSANFTYKHDFQELKLFQGPWNLKIEQIFNLPWAVNQDHVNLYCKTINEIINLPVFDKKINVLFQMIILLNTSECLLYGRLLSYIWEKSPI